MEVPDAQTRVKLKNGEEMVIKVLLPPLNEYAQSVACWWAEVKDELLNGNMTSTLFTPYFVGEIDGQVVGSMAYYAPADTQDVGVVEFVLTAEAHRGKGVSSHLLGHMIEFFKGRNGLALYLCTSNPIAGKLYEKHGFWYDRGDCMRYFSPQHEDFDQTYLADCGPAHVREVTWADVARMSVLFNHAQPAWLIKDYLTRSFAQTRFESHFVLLMKLIDKQNGAFLALENPLKRVVGAAVVARKDTFPEQHVATMSFRVCPEYMTQAVDLLNAVKEKARELSIKILQIHLTDLDHDQKQFLRAAGFEEEVRFRNRFRHENELVDLVIYSTVLPGEVRFSRQQEEYYGYQKAWQTERIAMSQEQSRTQ